MSRKYARGRRARAICQRGGHEIPYKRLVREPGTGLLVDKYWSDGRWNIVDHPQNFPPEDLADELPLQYPTGGTEFPPQTVTQVVSGVTLPGGGNLLVTTCLTSVTCVPLTDGLGNVLMVNASTTLVGCFSFLLYNSIENI